MSKRTCSLEECERPHYAKALCASHYQKARLSDPDRPRCSKPDCDRLVYSQKHGICRKHYSDENLADYWERYRTDPEVKARRKVQRQRWYQENAERAQSVNKAWREANPEKVRGYVRAWREANPELNTLLDRQSSARRRARIQATQSEPVEYTAILAEYGMCCHLCGLDIDSMADLHMDHVIPLSKGGAHRAENIRPAHATCNLRKAASLIDAPTAHTR